jgi:hypothetical protein
MDATLAITFGGGGDSDAGPSGSLIALVILVLLVGVPVALGVLLRIRDRRRGDNGGAEQLPARPAGAAPFGWGNVRSLRGETSTPTDWLIVGAFGVVMLVLLIANQL